MKVVPLSGACSRKMYRVHSQDFVHPITLEVIGAKSKLFGVRATIYNETTCSENGIFFTVED